MILLDTNVLIDARDSSQPDHSWAAKLIEEAAAGEGAAPKTPLPDFFIGAHADTMGWKLATRDGDRIARYFPEVSLVTPKK